MKKASSTKVVKKRNGRFMVRKRGGGVINAADKVKGLYLAAPPGAGAGSWSLAVDVDGSNGKSGTTIALQLCAGSAPATGLDGKFHATVWWKPSDSNGQLGGPGYAYLSGPGVNVGGRGYRAKLVNSSSAVRR